MDEIYKYIEKKEQPHFWEHTWVCPSPKSLTGDAGISIKPAPYSELIKAAL